MRLWSCLFTGLFCATMAVAQTVPGGFQVDTLLNLGSAAAPNDFIFLPNGDNRILFAGRQGTITVYTTEAPVPANATVGQIPSVQTSSEQGLLSICADPNWPTSPYIYVWYSPSTTSFMRLSRWQIGGDVANNQSTNLTLVAGSEYLILNDVPDSAFNHNGGTCRFGPDGMLWLAFGEDATPCDAQNRTILKGKLLRMTLASLPAGGGGPIAKSLLDPGDNPWSSSTNDNEALVVAYGLRNPFSFNMDSVSGDIFLADVGQNAREEFDYYPRGTGLPPGINFGWPWKEGINTFSGCGGSTPTGMVDPLDDYAQSTGGVSIMSAGFVRTSPTHTFPYPAAYDRNVFHNDYFNGTITRLTPSGATWTRVAGYWGTGYVGACRFQQDPINGDMKFIQHTATYATNGLVLKRIRVTAPLNQLFGISGGGQTTNITEPFANALTVQALTPGGAPLVNWPVNFTVTAGGVTLSAPNPVLTNASGFASVNVTAGAIPGAVTVVATTQGGDPAGVPFSMYQRGLRMTLIQGNPFDTMILNASYAQTPPSFTVNYLTMAGFSQPPFVTPLGTLCVNPFDTVNTVIVADAIGAFGFVNATNAIGSPNLTKVYTGIPQTLSGITLNFTGVGYDTSNGTFWFMNCAPVTF